MADRVRRKRRQLRRRREMHADDLNGESGRQRRDGDVGSTRQIEGADDERTERELGQEQRDRHNETEEPAAGVWRSACSASPDSDKSRRAAFASCEYRTETWPIASHSAIARPPATMTVPPKGFPPSSTTFTLTEDVAVSDRSSLRVPSKSWIASKDVSSETIGCDVLRLTLSTGRPRYAGSA